MLVFSRKTKESFLIGNDVKVTIFRAHNGKCRIGVEAPKDVKVVREEIADKIAEKQVQQ